LDWAAVLAAQLVQFHEHAKMFAEQFERPVGDGTLIAILAGWLAVGVQHWDGLRGPLNVVYELGQYPLFGQRNARYGLCGRLAVHPFAFGQHLGHSV